MQHTYSLQTFTGRLACQSQILPLKRDRILSNDTLPEVVCGIKRRIQTQKKLEKMKSGEKSPSVCASLQISFPASGWETPFGVVQYWLMPAGHEGKH